MTDDKYETLGMEIMFRGIKENELLEKWEYRKGKDFSDVRMAVANGRKAGIGKFERECMEIGFRLRRVLKQKSTKSTQAKPVAE